MMSPPSLSISDWAIAPRRWLVVDLRERASREAAPLPYSLHLGPPHGQLLDQRQLERLQNALQGRSPLILVEEHTQANPIVAQIRESGLQAFTLSGGAKAFQDLRSSLWDRPRDWFLLAGQTGAGKTEVLEALSKSGQSVLDLEAAAGHRGSVFGGLGLPSQPSQQRFENALWIQANAWTGHGIWVEDEDRNIGKSILPIGLWSAIQAAHPFMLVVPFEARLLRTQRMYGHIPIEQLVAATLRLSNRLGESNTNTVITNLQQGNTSDAFRILLAYYDAAYARRPLHPRATETVNIQWDGEDPRYAAALLLEASQL